MKIQCGSLLRVLTNDSTLRLVDSPRGEVSDLEERTRLLYKWREEQAAMLRAMNERNRKFWGRDDKP